MVRVEYNRDSFNECLCGGCPVNRFSECSINHEHQLDVEAIERDEAMPPPQLLAGIYCSTGKSQCHDMKGEKSCLCPACPVDVEFNLNSNYYCINGRAEEVVVA